MTRTKWENEGVLIGEGNLIHGMSGESMHVEYEIQILQEYLLARTRIPRQRNMHGSINPPPGWEVGVQHALRLEDGTVLKCWLNNQRGNIVCES